MSARTTLYGLFLSAALWACGSRVAQDPLRQKADLADVDPIHMTLNGEEFEPSDFDGNMRALNDKYPKTFHYVTKQDSRGLYRAQNKYLLQSSALENTDRTSPFILPNQFTVENVKEIAAILMQDEGYGFKMEQDLDRMTLEILAVFEGVSYKAYTDSEGKRTIGRGILMPKPRDPDKQELIAKIRFAANNAAYLDVHRAEAALDEEKELALAIDWLNAKGNYKDAFEKAVRAAVAFEDAPHLAAEDAREMDLRHIPPRYRALMTTMVWQTYSLFKRDPTVTAPALRVLADKYAQDDEKLAAFDDINFFYMDQCLLKNSVKEPFSDSRINLCVRPKVIAIAVRVAHEDIADENELDEEAKEPLPLRYLYSEMQAHIRDQRNVALMVQMGSLPCSAGEFTVNPDCPWKPDGRNRIVMGATGAVYTQKDYDGVPHLEKKLALRWDEALKQPVKAESDSVVVAIDDVMGMKTAAVRQNKPKP